VTDLPVEKAGGVGRRGRRTRSRRSRQAHLLDALPSPGGFDREIRRLILEALRLRQAYRRAYMLGLAPAGGSEVSVSGGGASTTEGVWASRLQRHYRKMCRDATESVRIAEAEIRLTVDDLRRAEAAVAQATELDDRASITPAEFTAALAKKHQRAMAGEDFGE
jgi:hypothetical protein